MLDTYKDFWSKKMLKLADSVEILEKIGGELEKIRKILEEYYKLEKLKHDMEMRKK